MKLLHTSKLCTKVSKGCRDGICIYLRNALAPHYRKKPSYLCNKNLNVKKCKNSLQIKY